MNHKTMADVHGQGDDLKRSIHTERAGLWEGHLAESEKMLPYLIAAGHYKYVSCLSHYLQAMGNLTTMAPSILQALKNGQFTIHQSEGRFNGVWTDMALEKTYNRDAQTKLFTGISQQFTAMEKYLDKVLPMQMAVSEQTKVMAHLNTDDPKHILDSNSQSIKDAACTKQIIEVIKNQMIDPFISLQKQKELLNISTGCIAYSGDLIRAREKVSEALAAVKNNRQGKCNSC